MFATENKGTFVDESESIENTLPRMFPVFYEALGKADEPSDSFKGMNSGVIEQPTTFTRAGMQL